MGKNKKDTPKALVGPKTVPPANLEIVELDERLDMALDAIGIIIGGTNNCSCTNTGCNVVKGCGG